MYESNPLEITLYRKTFHKKVVRALKKRHFSMHDMKIVSMCFGLAVVVLFVGFVQLRNTLIEKNQQIETLIAEVGRINESGFETYHSIGTLKKEVNQLYSKFTLQQAIAEESLFGSADSGEDPAILSQDRNFPDVLILGKHMGLTDTIMLLFANPKNSKIHLLSIPRDTYVSGRKINEYYYFYGPEKTAEMVGEITGITPEKYVVIDMYSFSSIIDKLGGVDVHLDEALVDYYFPGPGETTQYFSLSAGDHHLDGATALKYVRSRKSTSDFDRAERQQQVIKSLTNTLRNKGAFDNSKVMIALVEELLPYMKTNVDPIEALNLIQEMGDYSVDSGNVLSVENYLYSTKNQYGQYVLLPKDGDFLQIKAYLAELLKSG